MKPNNSNSGEETPKTTQSKTNKKSTKPRSKSSKSAELSNNNAGKNIGNASSNNAINSNSMLATTPTTPTTTSSGNLFESALAIGVGAGGAVAGAGVVDVSSSRNHHKSYVGLEPRSIKIIWEQHDQSDVELSAEVCARMAEDASYKLWELMNNVKTYARHSGGMITYDLVNEVLRDADVPPALGAMDSDWERIDYDGSFYFYSDKIIELREEYQKDVTLDLAYDAELSCAWPVEDKTAEILKKYIPSLIYIIAHGDVDALDAALADAAFAPIIGSCYRVILVKIIQILAFKQNEFISMRCWRFLRACSVNPCTRDATCREEYFHLAEILICQLLAPYESIKVYKGSSTKQGGDQQPSHTQIIKMEIDEVKLEQQMDMKTEFMDQEQEHPQEQDQHQEEKVYKLTTDEDDDDDDVKMLDEQIEQQEPIHTTSPYFANPVDWKHVDELCETIGRLACISGYFQSECLFHVLRRLTRFFDGRELSSEREYNFVSRAVRGLIALGEHAFREFIPFTYKFKADDVPEILWKDFSPGAIYLSGKDDIFLYEWLEFLCGADKLQPFTGYYAQYHEKLLTTRFLKRKLSTFKINAKVAVRRLEWSTLAAAMCHGDDPNKALKPKPTLQDMFPELVLPNLNLNRAGNIRFKFAGCRPIIIKPKAMDAAAQNNSKTDTSTQSMKSSNASKAHNDILIAKRKLLKPLTNERRVLPLSSYCFVRI